MNHMPLYSTHLYIERDGQDLDLVITGTVSDFIPSITHLPPEYCEPSSGGVVEIQSITLNGKPWEGELTDRELEQADDNLFDRYLTEELFEQDCGDDLDLYDCDPDETMSVNPYRL